MAELQTGKKIKRVRVNVGTEWFNQLWDAYLHEHGIIHESNMPYGHPQNSVAEHGIRTTIKGVRYMLADSGLSKSLWAKATSTAVYLCNFILSACHPGLIPAEVWSGKQQDVSHLCPF